MLGTTKGSNSGAPAVDQRAVRAGEIGRFVAEVIEKAGSVQAVVLGLHEMGFEGQGGGAYSEQTIRAWRLGTKMLGADVLCALSSRWGVSIDHYAWGMALRERVEEDTRRLKVLAPGESA